ncbi:MAG: four helix bundle protein [Flavobacteriales bacterium]|nr:four helix bundle protein [Flavobacteriales bacterium]|tara:strand:+ start:144 stop:488 length:345 start_codon:yes stop_codon:yes gene_type:complete
MFGFQSLNVYKKAQNFNVEVRKFLNRNNFDYSTENQLRRAALSVVLNISEGNGRFTDKDRRRFFIMSRSSLFECVGVFDTLILEESMKREKYNSLMKLAEELSRIIYTMIKNLS